MSADTRYPHIPLNEGERRRETELLKLAQAFANEMRRQGITYAMKGGTALRFTLGLPRPSMDLDFEGERPMWLRRAVKRAARKAFPGERYRVGYDLTREGTIPVRPPRKRGDDPGLGVDYRESGSMKGIPERIPLQACTFYKGVVVYNADELPHRKLQTLIGEEPREKARDIYDAGWLVTERPELIREDDREKLERWLAAKSPADIELLKERVRDDAITGRADAEDGSHDVRTAALTETSLRRQHDELRPAQLFQVIDQPFVCQISGRSPAINRVIGYLTSDR